MKLNERLKDLNELQALNKVKLRIRNEIEINQQNPKSLFTWNGWKEIGLVIGICFIGLFLIFTTSSELKNHAATDEITKITSYHNVTGEGFWGRTSTLFVGVKDILNEQTVLFFQNIDQLPPIENANINFHGSFDIVVIKNGEKLRYQLSENYLYDVDLHIIYPGYKEYPIVLADAFTEAHENSRFAFVFLIPIFVIVLNLVTQAFYRRRGIKTPEKLPGMGIAIMIAIITLAAIGYYVFEVGPIYRPLLFILAIIYGWLIWWPVKRNITNLHILKVERIKTLIMVLIMFFWILQY